MKRSATGRQVFYSIRQLAARWQVSEKSVRRYIARGDLAYHRFGNQVRVSTEDALAFERSRRDCQSGEPTNDAVTTIVHKGQ